MSAEARDQELLQAWQARRAVREAEKARLIAHVVEEQNADNAAVGAQRQALVLEEYGVEADCTLGEVHEAMAELLDDDGIVGEDETDVEPDDERFDPEYIEEQLNQRHQAQNDCYCRICDEHQDTEFDPKSQDDIPDYSEIARVIAAINLRTAGRAGQAAVKA